MSVRDLFNSTTLNSLSGPPVDLRRSVHHVCLFYRILNENSFDFPEIRIILGKYVYLKSIELSVIVCFEFSRTFDDPCWGMPNRTVERIKDCDELNGASTRPSVPDISPRASRHFGVWDRRDAGKPLRGRNRSAPPTDRCDAGFAGAEELIASRTRASAAEAERNGGRGAEPKGVAPTRPDAARALTSETHRILINTRRPIFRSGRLAPWVHNAPVSCGSPRPGPAISNRRPLSTHKFAGKRRADVPCSA